MLLPQALIQRFAQGYRAARLRRLLLRAAPLSAVVLGVPPAANPRAIPAAHPLPPCPQVLDGVLKEIATALLQADVNVRLVANLR